MICGKLERCVKRTIKGQLPDECDNQKENCIEFSDTRLYVKCEEKKKKYILENTMGNHVVSYRMDGGIVHVDAKVPEGVAKCDYLYVIDTDKPTAVLTELKGVDVAKAIQQIDSTLILFNGFFRKCSNVYGRIVVASTVPKLNASPAYVKLQNKLRNSYRGNLKVASRQMVEKDTELPVAK